MAQTDTSILHSHIKALIYVSGGLTLPLGNFSSYEIGKHDYEGGRNIAGAASTGFNSRLSAIYLFSENFGINVTFFSTNNKAAEPSSAELFNDDCPECQGLGGGYVRQSYEYHSTTWVTKGFLLGLSVVPYNENKLTFILRANPGLLKATSPESRLQDEGYVWYLNGPSYSSMFDETQPPFTSKYCFAIGGGADFIIQVMKKLNVVISMDYLNSKTSFNGNVDIKEFSGNTQTTHEYQYPVSFEKRISMFNLNVGIGYSFKSKK